MEVEQTREDPRIGNVIGGKYRLRRCVGVGSSGAVYQADQIALGRRVAIKILSEELTQDPRLVRRFQDEALAASRLNHPNAVSIIDFGQSADGLLYLVMEFLDGSTLTDHLQRRQPLGTSRIVEAVTQILRGLEEAHAAGVVHADLKSDNIVVIERRGGDLLYKVVDFGIARLVGAPSANPEPGAARTICGTPEYMSPEVIAGQPPTFASDIYAVGIILYELLIGTTPFVGGNTLEVLRRHLREEPIAPSRRRSDLEVHPLLEQAALRALRKAPLERFGDVLQFRDAVAAAVAVDETRDAVPCAECGVPSAASFKFCPECGHAKQAPRGRVGFDRAPTVDAAPAVPRAGARTEILPPPGFDVTRSIFPLPLVGREREREQLTEFLRGDTSEPLLQLVGPLGSGRSRLLAEAYQAVAGQVTIYQAGPDPTGLASPFYPVRAVVAAILALPPLCPYEGLGTALEAVGLSSRDLPGIGELFGHSGALWELEPPVRRRELLAATIRVLMTAANDGPAVLVFEDVDGYDQPSQELLRRLSERTNFGRLRIVVSNRRALSRHWPATAARLELAPLDDEDLATLAAHAAQSGSSDLPDAATLIRCCNGSPAHAEHLLRFLVEGGVLERLPEALVDLIAARIGLLPHAALLLCQAAAVFGNEVHLEVLRHAAAPSLGNDLTAALSILEARGLVYVEEGLLGFEHPLVRDVVYDATPAHVRGALHAAAADELKVTVYDAATLGHHNELAGRDRSATELLTRAGDDAVHQLDDAAAAQLYQRALRAARRLMLAHGDDELDGRLRFVTLSVKLADTLRVAGQVALARGILQEARAQATGAAALESQLLRAAAHLSLTEADSETARATLRRAIGASIPAGNMELVTELYLDLSAMLLRDGDTTAAIAELEEGLDLITLGEGGGATGGSASLWRLLLRLAQLRSALDQGEGALTLGCQALAHARRVHSAMGAARVQALLASHCERMGDAAAAAGYRQAAVEEMRRLGDRRGTAELLLAGLSAPSGIARISSASLEEARELAAEVGWSEGVARARSAEPATSRM